MPLPQFTMPSDFVSRRRAIASTGALALTSWLGATVAWGQPAAAPAPDYQPRRGQPGKDVVWIATPNALVSRMLRLAQLGPRDTLIDLGSGDGKIVIGAALEGAQGLGIEYNPELVALSRQRAIEAGAAGRTRFEKADIFESDFSQATVITMYLLPKLNLRLRPRLMALKPGTRIVSHEFRMGRWPPDEVSRVGPAHLYLWLVPANAGGDWELRFTQGGQTVTAPMALRQRFQQIEGEVGLNGFQALLREGRVAGEQASFGFTDAQGHLRHFVGRVAGDVMSGTVDDLTAGGARTEFSARRLGVAPPIEGAGPAPESEAESLGNE